jgi:hypothetical protein
MHQLAKPLLRKARGGGRKTPRLHFEMRQAGFDLWQRTLVIERLGGRNYGKHEGRVSHRDVAGQTALLPFLFQWLWFKRGSARAA